MADPNAPSAWHRAWALDPIFEWVRPEAQTLCELTEFPSLVLLNRMLADACERAKLRPLTLRPSPPKSKRRPPWRGAAETYDGHIVERAEVPSREDNWHDLMNALSWICFPRSKWTLHQAQYAALVEEVERLGGARPQIRGRERDRLTLLDEAGLIELRFDATQSPAFPGPGRSESAVLALHQPRAPVSVAFGHALYENVALRRPEVTPWHFQVQAAAPLMASDDFAKLGSLTTGALEGLRDKIDESLSVAIAREFNTRPWQYANTSRHEGDEVSSSR